MNTKTDQTVAEALPQILNHLATGGTVVLDSPIGHRELWGAMMSLLTGIDEENVFALHADIESGDERSVRAYKDAFTAMRASLFYPVFAGDDESTGFDFFEQARRIQLRHPDRELLALSGVRA